MSRILWDQLAAMNTHYFHYPFEYFLETQKEFSIKKLELWGAVPHLWIDHTGYESPAGLLAQAKELGMDFAAHTPRPYGYSLCVPERGCQKENSMSYYNNCVDVTHEIQAPYLCLNFVGGCFDYAPGILWDSCRESLKELCRYAQGRGVQIALGTVSSEDGTILGTLPKLVQMIREVQEENLKALLDTYVISQAKETIDQWFTVLGEKIVHIHFTDGRNASPRIWGEGIYPLRQYLNALAQKGYSGALGMPFLDERYWDNPRQADKTNYTRLLKFCPKGWEADG